MKKVVKSRNYIFTINNYNKTILNRFIKVSKSLEKHSYICYGLEIAPSTGTKHIQGYIQLNDNQRFTFLHNYFSLKRKGEILKFHVQQAKGTYEENKKYASKDGDFQEYGEPKKQGARSDLTALKELVRKNPTDIFNIVDSYTNNNQQLRYVQNLQQYYFKKRSYKKPPVVLWIYGESGTGKSHSVYESFDEENICSVSNYDWLGTDYIQQEVFLLDDFRPYNIKFNHLLKITDKYPISLFYKGGQIPLNSPYIIITTPKSIEDTYIGDLSFTEDLKQLKRRCIEVPILSLYGITIKEFLQRLDK